MKREILRTLDAINRSLTLIEKRLSTLENTGATRAETTTMALAVTGLKTDLEKFLSLHHAEHDRRIRVLEETDSAIGNRVLNLERAGGMR